MDLQGAWYSSPGILSPPGQHHYTINSQNVELCNVIGTMNSAGISVSNVCVEVLARFRFKNIV